MELKSVQGIGPKTLEKLNANQIYTVKDLLMTFPKKYTFYNVDNQNVFSGEMVCFKCKVQSRPVVVKTVKHSKAFVFYILVNNMKYKCIIFSGDYLRYKLYNNVDIICYGKFKPLEKEFSITNIFFEDFKCKVEIDYGFYDIANASITKAINYVLANGYELEDNLPKKYIEKYRLLGINELVRKIHFPNGVEDYIEIKRRTRYEDFFWYTSELEILRLSRGFEEKKPKIVNKDILNDYIEMLPYDLTNDQKESLNMVIRDLESNKPMNRLLEGDVGSGKTIVSFLACISTIKAGYQTAIMAPTEILAIQHYNNFKKMFDNFNVELLTSSTKQKDKNEILFKLLHGRIDLLIGTHALIQDSVIFSNLGLVVIDEQHRFGVNQRKALVEKFKGVDALYMTATPIPRTLGLTAFGDLDLSLIKEKPANRKPIITEIISLDKINNLGKILNRHLIMDEQIYIVVPLINVSESFDFIDINQAYNIFTDMLPEARIEILHGKMKSKDKDAIMEDFKNHQIDVLISTTVIEVGVDVKNASTMVILNAERYGLSQIHQLRGRVGRGNTQSYCYLVTDKEQTERLQILERINDGFILAEEDFRLRGPGDFLWEEQSGFSSLNFDFESKDLNIWKCAVSDSKEYVLMVLGGLETNTKMLELLKNVKTKNNKLN